MSRRRDYTGIKVGKLTAVSQTNEKNRMHVLWWFKCDCGEMKKLVPSQVLKKKNGIRTCGHFDVIETFLNVNVCIYKEGARKRNLIWKLTDEEALKMFFNSCYYCGIASSNIKEMDRASIFYNGIDRLDNKKGYISDNCVACCITCNKMKMNLGEQEFLDKVSKIFLYKISNEIAEHVDNL